jgi:hypothetical protein
VGPPPSLIKSYIYNLYANLIHGTRAAKKKEYTHPTPKEAIYIPYAYAQEGSAVNRKNPRIQKEKEKKE